MAKIQLETIIDPLDYIDEIDIDDLIDELKNRGGVPNKFKCLDENSRTPIRNILIDILNLGVGATIEDIQNSVKENYYK